MKAFECSVETFVVSGESAKACRPCEASLDHPSSGQEHETAPGHGVFHNFEPDAVVLGCGRGGLANVALVDIGQFDLIAGHLLHLHGQRLDLRPVALVCRSHGEGEQVAKRIDRDMYLRALPAPGPVLGGTGSALGRRLKRAAVDHCRRRLALSGRRTAATATARLRQSARNIPHASSAASAGRPQAREEDREASNATGCRPSRYIKPR